MKNNIKFLAVVFAFGAFGAFLLFTLIAQAYQEDALMWGYKFYDTEGNGGVRIDGEPGIDDWHIKLLLPDGEGGIDEVESTDTYDGGYYAFYDEFENGTYLLCERDGGENWTQTYPAEDIPGTVSCHGFNEELDEELEQWGWEVTIENGEITSGPESFDFGNTTELGNISVVKFNDLNSNGVRDEGELGIEGIEFRLNDDDLADNFLQQLFSWFLPEDFDRFTTTNENGVAEWDRRLPAGTYEIEEQDGENGWISTTDDSQEVELGPGEIEEIEFGNRKPALVVYKYDNNSGELISGWEICLYEAVFDENEGAYVKGNLVEPCQETINDHNEETEETGDFHGAAVFSSDNLDPDRWYVVDEEERAGWRLEEFDSGGDIEIDWDFVNEEEGQVPVHFDDSFFENGEDAQLYLYNRDIGGDIVALKYIDENLGIVVRGWKICLREFDEETGEAGAVIGECKETDEGGVVSWQNVLPGTYILDEEEREVWGWQQQGFSTGEFDNAEWQEFGPEGAGQVMVLLYDNGYAEIHFLNGVNDQEPPHSFFEDPMEHHVIDTKIVSLELRGTSVDNLPVVVRDGEDEEILGSSGIREAALTVRQLAGSEAVENFPSSSFFDVFTALRCPESESIPIEIVSLTLTSVNPITVVWDTEVDLGRHGLGIYCFEVRATDNAGNPEETGYAGPIAYVPVAQISEELVEEPTQTSFTVTWTTNKPTTSRVIYDILPHAELGDAPNYGYAFSTPKTDTEPMVNLHSVVVSGLDPGTTYYYRTVSSASPESVGEEGSVTTGSPPPSPPQASTSGSGSSGGGGSGGTNNFAVGIHSEPSSGGGSGDGEVLGASAGPTINDLESQIASLKAQIEELKKKTIPLIELLIQKLFEELEKLQAMLALLLAEQGE